MHLAANINSYVDYHFKITRLLKAISRSLAVTYASNVNKAISFRPSQALYKVKLKTTVQYYPSFHKNNEYKV